MSLPSKSPPNFPVDQAEKSSSKSSGETSGQSVPPHGMYRIAAVSPPVHVANPAANGSEIIELIGQTYADLIVFPELCLTGYTCGDLLTRRDLLDAASECLLSIAPEVNDKVAVVGLPLVIAGSVMNVAAVICNRKIVGVVPKSFLPNYREFYEDRHFRPARDTDPATVRIGEEQIPFGTDLLFRVGDATIAVEICEDFWMPVPPSSLAAIAGANVLVNLSASNETIGKMQWRRDLVLSQSGRCIAAYAYASAGPGESTSDLVFGGHCLIAENGSLLSDTHAIHDDSDDQSVCIADVDLERLANDRRVIGSFFDSRLSVKPYRTVDLNIGRTKTRSDLRRRVDATPFVPKSASELELRCAEIFDLQTAGLVKRLSILPADITLSIGISGGLDSTLALLVAVRACDKIGKSRADILGLSMPGFGTTNHTRTSADQLMAGYGIAEKTIDIRQQCLDTFVAMNHQPLGIAVDDSTTVDGLQSKLNSTADGVADLTFENVQARLRTLLLMSHGFVLGTGDMSEQATGWCTYNADHMSMYNVNTSIPKTLVQFLVRYVADTHFSGEMTATLNRIADTPISPELLPPSQTGTIRQSTEASLGAYELHDFFLYHFIRHGAGREKILYLAEFAQFESTSDAAEIAATYERFERRFYANQFKRNCVPDGPKVGSVSLSPRGDWRMPSDAERFKRR